MITIGIDPGSKSGLAIWRGTKLVHVSTVKLRHAEDWRMMSAKALDAFRLASIPLDGSRLHHDIAEAVMVATEAQYLKGKGLGRMEGMQSVLTKAVTWRVVLDMMRARILPPVHAASWRSTFGIAAREGDASLKQQAVDLVRDHLHMRVTEDEAEAILLGLHAHLLRYDEPPTEFAWVSQVKAAQKAATAAASKAKRSKPKAKPC